MNKEKSAFPSRDYFQKEEHGITYRQYLAARVYPEILRQVEVVRTWDVKNAAELTWQAVDALIKAEEASNEV